MRRSVKIIIPLLVVMAGYGYKAKAQMPVGEMRLNLLYNYSKPQGSFSNDMISKGSPRGGKGELMYGISRTLAAGLQVGFQDYYQKYPRAVYPTNKSEDISAVLTNSVQTTPIIAKVLFSPLGNQRLIVQPYVSAGAGLNLINYRQYLGQFESNDASAGFVAQAGAGIQIPLGGLSSSGIMLGVNYNYAPYSKFGFKNLNTLDFQAGVFLPLR
ncbi:hypothetical protein HNQ91_005036 [Filimonas zeae]|nr:outer membrane beta-barrel protein [Filimonas zeae]MDR6341959.1 hypothetical protein [Filimonas zeae]